jgi:hypothetical protein
MSTSARLELGFVAGFLSHLIFQGAFGRTIDSVSNCSPPREALAPTQNSLRTFLAIRRFGVEHSSSQMSSNGSARSGTP